MNTKGLSIDQLVKRVLSLVFNHRFIFVSIAGVALLAYTALNTMQNIQTQKDQQHFEQLQSEVVFTKFNQETIDKIRQLDVYKDSVDSDFLDERNNPFAE